MNLLLRVKENVSKIILPISFLLILTQLTFAQNVEKPAKNEISAEVKNEAVALIRETSVEVGSLRNLENRISFQADMASLMWFSDEKEARTMFQTVINDFRQLLGNYDSQMNSLGVAPETIDVYSPDTGDKAQIARKFQKAFSIRQQIATAIAEHDAELALSFFTETGSVISNPTYRKQLESNDIYFETRLLNQIAAQNIDTALKYGRKTLAKGFNYELINLLKKIYEKDADKGAAFGEEIIAKLKSDSSKSDGFYYLGRVLSEGIENFDAVKGKSGKPPMFSESSLRDLADLLAQEFLKRGDGEVSDLSAYLGNIERFQPARTAQIRQKFSINKKIGSGNANRMLTATIPPPPVPIKIGQETQKQLTENLQNLKTQKLSDDDRKKVIEQSRKIIAETPNRDEKFLTLTVLAAQVAKLGDKELALELMSDVRNLTNLQPKNYRDYMEVWLLASGYAQVDSDKAFPILEDAIFRLNDTINAFVKVGEFIDTNGEMIDDGEIQIGSFGGNLSRELLSNLGAADSIIRNLAVADFARTKSLANKFERPEARILAKMLVLRAVLMNNGSPPKEDLP